MKPSSAVLSALQQAHDAEATASERWHKQEHEFKDGPRPVKGLGKLYDRLHKAAYCRQHDLRKHMMKLGSEVQTNLGDTSYWRGHEVRDEGHMGAMLDETADHLEQLHDLHAKIVDAANRAGDQETSNRFRGRPEELMKQARKARRRADQARDLGIKLFLHEHS
jgi:hypothetical protein